MSNVKLIEWEDVYAVKLFDTVGNFVMRIPIINGKGAGRANCYATLASASILYATPYGPGVLPVPVVSSDDYLCNRKLVFSSLSLQPGTQVCIDEVAVQV